MESNKKQKSIENGICYALLVVLALIFLFPLYWFFLNSLKSYEDLFQFPPKFWVWPLRFENYPEAYAYPALQFGKMLLNSTIITLVSVFGAVVSSTIVAYGFSRLRWRGRDKVFVLVKQTL